MLVRVSKEHHTSFKKYSTKILLTDQFKSYTEFWLILWICWSLLKEMWYFWPSQALICHCCRCFDWKRPTWDWILSFTNDVGKTNEIGNGNTITQNFITLGRQCKTWSRLKMMRSSRGPQVLCEPVYCTVWAR